MLKELRQLERSGTPIRVGLAGGGCMGKGIASQVARTPGMQLAWVGDHNLQAAEEAAAFGLGAVASQSLDSLFDKYPVDVFVEATNSIGAALDYSLRAIEEKSHVVLMNAEVDLAFGSQLLRRAEQGRVVMTSDAGDQHGVLAGMIEEAELWGMKVVQVGNIKGFLNRYATASDLLAEASKRRLDPIQCCAYTDGSKLNIEMAVLANAYGYRPSCEGMTGPRAERVEDVLGLFDFASCDSRGEVDYILGAEPGGGVYLVVSCEDEFQHPYLSYYKLGDGPYYLLYRPYHLCHLETVKAVAQAALNETAILQPSAGRTTDVFARAKRDLLRGTVVDHSIGGEHFYGLIDHCQASDQRVALAMLETQKTGVSPVVNRDLQKDEVVTVADIDWPTDSLLEKEKFLGRYT